MPNYLLNTIVALFLVIFTAIVTIRVMMGAAINKLNNVKWLDAVFPHTQAATRIANKQIDDPNFKYRYVDLHEHILCTVLMCRAFKDLDHHTRFILDILTKVKLIIKVTGANSFLTWLIRAEDIINVASKFMTLNRKYMALTDKIKNYDIVSRIDASQKNEFISDMKEDMKTLVDRNGYLDASVLGGILTTFNKAFNLKNSEIIEALKIVMVDMKSIPEDVVHKFFRPSVARNLLDKDATLIQINEEDNNLFTVGAHFLTMY